MGDRIVYTFKYSDGNEISLYSHWGGYDRYKNLAYAIDKARPRWNDETYAARIMISNLIGPDWDQETGYGLWPEGEVITSGDHDDIIIHLDSNAVEDETGWHEFDEFIDFHSSKLDKKESTVV